jgi:hypothetical protein
VIVVGVTALVGSTLYYQVNYGTAIAVTPVIGFPLTLTGKNFVVLHPAARYVVLQHELLHQRGERSEKLCYKRQLALSSYILSKGSFDGSSLTDPDVAELQFLKQLAAINSDDGLPN